jgi:amidase
MLELNPAAEKIARKLDAERQQGHLRGPLHGIPITLKGNIDTADKMQTSAGSLALSVMPPAGFEPALPP